METAAAIRRPEAASLGGETGGELLYSGFLLYVAIFYTQVYSRIPALGVMRLELVVGTAVLLLALNKLAGGGVSFGENRLNQAALIFLFAAVATLPLALVKTRALNMFITFLKYFAIYLMIISAVDTRKRLQVFIWLYMALIAFIFMEPFFLSLQGKGFVWNNHMMRLAGTTNYFGHPNQLGGVTAENLPFFFYLMVRGRGWWRKLLGLGLILAAARVVMLTQSRTGFLGVLACGFFIWLLSRRKLVSAVALVVCVAVAWQFAPEQTRQRFLTLTKLDRAMIADRSEFSPEEKLSLGSINNRWELIKRGLVAFRENPVLGLGLNCFISFNGNRYGYWFPPHNTYVQALAEMGLVGFLAFSYVIVMTFVNLGRSHALLRQGEDEDVFLTNLNMAVAVYLMVRLVVGFFGQDLYANFWWIAGGLSVVILRVARARQPLEHGPAAAARPVAGVKP